MASQPQGGSSSFQFKDPFDLLSDLHNARFQFMYKNEFARGNRPNMNNVGGGGGGYAVGNLDYKGPQARPNNFAYNRLSAPQDFGTPDLDRGEEGRIGKVAGPAISSLAGTINNLYQNRKLNKNIAGDVSRLGELNTMQQDVTNQREALRTTIKGNKTIASTRTAQRQQQAQQVKVGNQVNQATLVAGYGADPYQNAYQAGANGLPQQALQNPAGPPRPPLWQNPPAQMVPGGFAPPGPANNWHGQGPPAGYQPPAGAPVQAPRGPRAGHGVPPGVGPNIQRRPKATPNLPLAPTNVAGPVSPINPPEAFDKSGNTQVLGGATPPETTTPATEGTGQSAPSTRPSLSDRRAQSRQRRGRGLNPG